MAHHVALGHERSERPADHDGVRAPSAPISASTSSAICGTVQRAGSPASERRWRGGRARARAIPPPRAIERGEPDRAVETRAAVERDEGPPLPALVDVELDVADRDAHQNVASRAPVAITSRMIAASTSR